MFFNDLQTAFNNSIAIDFSSVSLGVQRDQFSNYLKGRNFVRDFTGSTGTAITDYLGIQLGQDLKILGNFAPILPNRNK